ncbi:M23 family metallopeptidase [Alteraurantiacibacter aquimixticola]|uniref:M23 family metallopeptidase n=1 Tax=Alteraurantiacibacter aquimixticola TaxID=2489173 RepID=A0A4T3EXV1_9SPHN|nr:M23 family metallopeptidase [Alteraurantiacibacter aquimixticola]
MVPDDGAEAERVETVQPIAEPEIAEAPRPEPTPTPTPTPVGPTTFVYDGELIQGGWLRGQVPGGTEAARLGDQELAFDEDGYFFAAFDRDAGPEAQLVALLEDGREIVSPLAVAPRDWQIERVNVARSPGGASAAFMERRRPELAQINAARTQEAPASGWSEDFIWPLSGRISGRFGSQRIYRGEPGSYHSGIDIATGGSGNPFVAPAAGVVTLATAQPFSLEGYLLIIDHGQGLNSAFLHLSEIAVSEGEAVEQGQYLGRIGSSGRATGPHLHWSLKWRDARLDPLLFTGPMP